MTTNKYLKLIGNVLTILALIFIVRSFMNMDIDYSIFGVKENIIYFIILCFLYTVHLLLIPWSWRKIIQIITKKKLSFFYVQKVFCKANVMKYIPGNIFQYVGRNEIAVDCDLKHSSIALTTIGDILANILGAGMISLIGFTLGWTDIIDGLNETGYSWKLFGTLVIVIFAVVLLLVLGFRKKIVQLIKPYTEVLTLTNLKAYLTCILWYALFAVYTSALYLFILIGILGIKTEGIEQIFLIVGAYQLSWLAGFLLPGSPGGIGIREFILTIILQRYINLDAVMLAIVIYRLVNVLGDFGAVLTSSLNYRRLIWQNRIL